MNNIILIGMPGAGKSTIGVLLAKASGREFIDTDILLQNSFGMLLHEFIRKHGVETFIRKEENFIKTINCSNTIIATGGSVVLSHEAMNHLKTIGIIIYLKIDTDTVVKRINNIQTRGIVKETDQTLGDIYIIRTPLYEKYSDRIIDCTNRDHEQILNEIVAQLEKQ